MTTWTEIKDDFSNLPLNSLIEVWNDQWGEPNLVYYCGFDRDAEVHVFTDQAEVPYDDYSYAEDLTHWKHISPPPPEVAS